jgi:hypothetical protein
MSLSRTLVWAVGLLVVTQVIVSYFMNIAAVSRSTENTGSSYHEFWTQISDIKSEMRKLRESKERLELRVNTWMSWNADP